MIGLGKQSDADTGTIRFLKSAIPAPESELEFWPGTPLQMEKPDNKLVGRFEDCEVGDDIAITIFYE